MKIYPVRQKRTERYPYSNFLEVPACVLGIKNDKVVFTADFFCGELPEADCSINILVVQIDEFKRMYCADDIEKDFLDE